MCSLVFGFVKHHIPPRTRPPFYCSDLEKLRAALALVSEHQGKPLRLELQAAAA